MILVSGGAGVMGSNLVKGLVKAGHKVRVLTLPNDPYVSRLEGVDCEMAYGDVRDADSLKGVFDGVKTVYHLAAVIIACDESILEKVNVQGVRNTVDGATAAGVEHFIHVSSASVIFPNASAYAKSKIKGEEVVRACNDMHFTIVRPTLVYDRGGGQEFLMFLESLKKYPFVPFVGRGHALKNPVYVGDMEKGLLAIAGNKSAYGKTYNFSGGEDISIWDLAKLMLECEGASKPFFPIPLPVCRGIAFAMERVMKHPPLTGYAISRIVQNANLDNSEARKDLGYDPIGVREGLPMCYDKLS